MAMYSNLSHVKKYFNFKKHEGITEIFLVIEPGYTGKVFLPIDGTNPLNPAIIDNTTHSYVFFAQEVVYLKAFNFILHLSSEHADLQNIKLPLPSVYIDQSLTDDERKSIRDILNLRNTTKYEYFQVTSTDAK